MLNIIKYTAIGIILAICLVVMAARNGGDGIRGAGDSVSRGLEDIAEAADLIKESAEDIRNAADGVEDSIRKTGKKIRNALPSGNQSAMHPQPSH